MVPAAMPVPETAAPAANPPSERGRLASGTQSEKVTDSSPKLVAAGTAWPNAPKATGEKYIAWPAPQPAVAAESVTFVALIAAMVVPPAMQPVPSATYPPDRRLGCAVSCGGRGAGEGERGLALRRRRRRRERQRRVAGRRAVRAAMGELHRQHLVDHVPVEVVGGLADHRVAAVAGARRHHQPGDAPRRGVLVDGPDLHRVVVVLELDGEQPGMAAAGVGEGRGLADPVLADAGHRRVEGAQAGRGRGAWNGRAGQQDQQRGTRARWRRMDQRHVRLLCGGRAGGTRRGRP